MFQFKINREKWEHLVALKGWVHPITILAKRTGFGKSYCSQVINGGMTVSHDFMAKYIEVCGASTKNPEEWACLFDLVKEPVQAPEKEPYRYKDPEPWQKDNYRKSRGEIPYEEYSVTGHDRKIDYARSLTRLRLDNPIPANQFFDMIERRDQGYRGDGENYWQGKRARHKKKSV
jgi:hypothetical protein